MTSSGDKTTNDHSDLLIAQLRAEDHDRYFAALFAPSEIREKIIALYCFHIELAKTAEAVSEVMLGEIRLQWWREALDLITEGHVREHPVVAGLSALDLGADLRRELDMMIDSRGDDLEAEGPQSRQAFKDYLDKTGGALMRAAGMIAKLPEDQVHTLGKAGYVHALTGVLRALEFHAGLGHASLPEQGDISPKELGDADVAALQPVLEDLVHETEQILAELRAAWPQLHPSAKGLGVVAFYARPVIRRLRKQNLDPRGLSATYASDFARLCRLAQAFLPWSKP